MFVDGTNGIRPIGDGLLEVSDASLSKLIASGHIDDIYDVEQAPFARGKFATVRRAMHKKTGVNFAAKFLRRRRRAQCTMKEIRHEIAILLLCAESPNIVKLFSVHETHVETALVLEMANGGELQTLLDENGSLTERETIICMQEVLKALQFLHRKCIAHLDLKPQNILLCGKRVEDGLKLCDFGISRIVEETSSKVREILGTPDYVAPEVLSYEPLSLRTDIWSVGVLAYVLLSGFSPFGGDTKQETFLNISQCNLNFPDDLFENVTEDGKDFIKSALQVTAEDRMSADECLEHKWLIGSTAVDNKTAVDIQIQPKQQQQQQSNGDTDSNKSNGIDYVTETPSSPSIPTTPKSTSNGFYLHQQSPTSKNRTTFLKQNLQTFNPNSMNCNTNGIVTATNNANELLKEFATNKENINLSKILANRNTQSSSVAHKGPTTTSTTTTTSSDDVPSQTSSIQVQQNDNKTMPSMNNNNNNNNSNNNNNNSTTTATVVTAHETILFPDAPTTPKVIRKSANESDSDTPSCVALVKQFQLNNGNLSTTQKKLTGYDQDLCPETTTTLSTSYRLSATAITAKNGHLNSITSSTLSINTITDTSVGVQSDSTVTINCLCTSVDKTGNCCCSTSSRQALNYRKKSLAVLSTDNSILC